MGYPDEVLADSPLVYYRLDGPSGRDQDDSGNNRDLTAVGSNFTNFDSLLPIGGTNGSCAFNDGVSTGSLDLADSTPVDFPGTDQYTIECWVRPLTVDSTFRRVYTWTDESDAGTNGYQLVYHTSGFYANRRVSGVDISAVWNPTPSVGKTYYVVQRYDGANIEVWGNGVFITETAAGSQGAYAGDLRVGAAQFGGSSGHMILDEVAIYSGSLSQARIEAHYAAGLMATIAWITA